MRILFLILALIGCQACGHEPDIDPELKLLLDHYLRFAPNSGKLEEVDEIKFGTPPEGHVADCAKDDEMLGDTNLKIGNSRTITIGRGTTRAPLAVIVYHELGHCLHDLPHVKGQHNIMAESFKDGPEYWTSEQIDTALQAMFLGLEIP